MGSAKMRDLTGLEYVDAEDIRAILRTAHSFKDILSRPVKKVPALRGKSVILLFYEASTRTRTSFETAAKILSADAMNISVAQSSVVKGESLKDTLLTLQSLAADCIVMRHSSSGAAEFAAKIVDIPVVNAGDGRHEHPTQGLLDMYTIWEKRLKPNELSESNVSGAMGIVTPPPSFDFSGLTVSIVGDLAHSRVARSDVWGMVKLGAKVRWVGPKTLLPIEAERLPIEVYTDLRTGLKDADVVIVLRLQTERQEKGLLPSLREYSRMWGINENSLREAKPGVLVMHPGPMNRGVEISPRVADGIEGAETVIERQVTNGVAVRMAVLYKLIGDNSVDQESSEEDDKRNGE